MMMSERAHRCNSYFSVMQALRTDACRRPADEHDVADDECPRILDSRQTMHIQESFIHQLEVAGHWEWAVYVAAHLKHGRHTHAIKQILQRHCPGKRQQDQNEFKLKEHFLVEQLHVPKAVRGFSLNIMS
jgi:hypothetical protein